MIFNEGNGLGDFDAEGGLGNLFGIGRKDQRKGRGNESCQFFCVSGFPHGICQICQLFMDRRRSARNLVF